MGGLRPLHFASGLVGGTAVEIVRLLVYYGADRNARDEDEESYASEFLEKEWRQDQVSEPYDSRPGGRTALHIVCSRDDNFEVGNPDILWSGVNCICMGGKYNIFNLYLYVLIKSIASFNFQL